jgi:hypothetical protein
MGSRGVQDEPIRVITQPALIIGIVLEDLSRYVVLRRTT